MSRKTPISVFPAAPPCVGRRWGRRQKDVGAAGYGANYYFKCKSVQHFFHFIRIYKIIIITINKYYVKSTSGKPGTGKEYCVPQRR